MKKSLLLVIAAFGSLLLNACGGGGGTPPQQLVATHLSVMGPAAAPVAGTAFNVAVSALDASNTVVTSYSGMVHFTSSDIQATLPADSPLTGGTKTYSVTFKTSGPQTIMVADAAGVLTAGNSGSITVSPGAATQFSVSAPASASIGTAFAFTVTAQDASKNTATGYSGKVHFTSGDPHPMLPADSSLTSGAGSFSATLSSAGPQTITATDTASASITGASTSIAVQTVSVSISSGHPPNGTVNAQYGTLHHVHINQVDANVFLFQLTATAGNGTYLWNWAAGSGSSLPPGLTCCRLTIAGQPPFVGGTLTDVVSGVPTAAGTYNVVVNVRDTATPQGHGSANYTIVIAPPPPPVMNTAPPLAIATLNSPYVGFNFTATGGQLPYAGWTQTGVLPQGMMFDSTGGKLSGTPAAAGSFPIAVKVTDSVGQDSPLQEFTIQVLSMGFKPTGSMGTARFFQTATLLCDLSAPACNDKKVLVAGGFDATGTLATAELYDPASGTFAPTGSVATARTSNTATFLNNGKVLVTGGEDATFNPLASAELFDPATGTFSPTGSMATARAGHTATLLKDGRVLVAGGQDAAGSPLATAELFDPTGGTFSPTGSMGTARERHTATLLKDGRVLVAGYNLTAELFDPASGSFSPTGSMSAERSSYTATLLKDGRVLMAGGLIVPTAELYDPAAGTFSLTGNMLTTRNGHTATLLNDGTVLVTGGADTHAINHGFSSAELFDPVAGSFSLTADMTTVRRSHTATLLSNGEVLVTGGCNDMTGGSTVGGCSTTAGLATAEMYH